MTSDSDAAASAVLAPPARGRVGGWLVDRLWRPFIGSLRSAYEKQAYPLGYAPGLDGLRAVITLAVVLSHIRVKLAPGAAFSLDIFFTMSGYFITALLLRDWTQYRRIRFGAFYRRRFARILPPFVAMVAAYLAFAWLFLPDFRASLTESALALAYLTNLWRAHLLPWIAPVQTPYLAHTWSLAIEEQFYLVWPCLLLLLLRGLGLGWRLLAAILILAVALWAWRILLTWQGAPSQRLYNGTDTRADALMIGCALAVWLRVAPAELHGRLARRLASAAWPLLLLLGGAIFLFGPDSKTAFYHYAGSNLLGALPAAAVIVILIRPERTILHRVFELPWLIFLGRIFYAIYLWHFPIVAVMNWQYGLPAGVRTLIALPLIFLLSVLSYALIERHFMRTAQPARARPAIASA